MPNVAFGGTNGGTTSYTGAGIYTSVAIGARRIAANGQGPQLITQLYGYLGGRGGACTGTIYIGSSSAAGVSIPSASNGATLRGPFNTSDWYIANGTTTNYGFNATGGTHSFYFGRNTTGTTYDTSSGSWTGTAGGTYTYVQSPSAPGNLTLTSAVMGQVVATWNEAGTGSPVVAGDNGGSVVTGYRVQYSLVETFGSGVTTVDIATNTTTTTVTGLTPGATYFFRVASKNAVTTAASTTSVYSTTKSVYVMVDAALAYETLHPSRNAVTPLQDGGYWSLTGHGIGFDRSGNMIKPDYAPYTYNYYSPEAATYMTSAGNVQYNIVKVSGSVTDIPSGYVGAPLDPFIVYPTNGSDRMFANNIQYGSLLPRRISSTTNSVYRMAYKTRLWYPNKDDWYGTRDYFKHEVSWRGLPDDSFLFTGQQYYYSIDHVTEELYLKIIYIDSTGAPAQVEQAVSFAGLTFAEDEEINVYLEFTYDSDFNYRVAVAMCSAYDTDNFVMTSGVYTTKRADIYCTPVTIKGVARSLYVTHSDKQDFVNPYVWETSDYGYATNGLTFEHNSSKAQYPAGPALGVNMNGWEYLQAAAAASNMEISLGNDEINVRYTGSKVLDLDNIVPSFAITPSTTFSGRNVEVQYNNAVSISAADFNETTSPTEIPESRPEEMYNAFFDNNQDFSVEVGEVLKKTVKTNNYPLVLAQPVRVVSVTDPTTQKVLFSSADDLYGQYSVSDKNGLLLGAYGFEANGGKVEVAINPDIPNAIDITFTAPEKAIPSYEGPYSLSINDGKTKWASLSILGYGLKTEPEKIKLLTGSTPSKTPQEISKTIINPFIDTLERAYDQGAWAATDASGPKVTISGAIPITSLEDYGFGVTPGSIIKYKNNSYRINDLNIGNIQASFNASRYVTVSDFDSAWARDGVQRTVGFHDGVWYGKEVQDEIVLSYYGADTVNGGYIDIDTDGHPYLAFDVNGFVGGFLLLFDEDDVPYYEPISAGLYATLLYLDTDFSPYYL